MGVRPMGAEGCAMVATFRHGKGSAVALGSNEKGLVESACDYREPWEGVAEHVGHTAESIAEYCANMIPDQSAMDALTKFSPGYIVAKAKQGQLADIIPGMEGQKYIVLDRPDIGECLFTTSMGKYGAALCTCQKDSCNGKDALSMVVDSDEGPMRLLQFLDGSLSEVRDAINAVAPGILDSNGNINTDNVM